MNTSRIPATARPSKIRRFFRIVVVLFLILGLLLVIERIYGKWKLASVKTDMARRGQPTEFKQLLTPAPPHFAEFTNRLMTLSGLLGSSMLYGSGNRIDVAPGKAARGSQAPNPWNGLGTNAPALINGMAHMVDTTDTWTMLEQRLATNSAALAELRDLLRDPPPVLSADYLASVRDLKTPAPNFVSVRVVAQVLNDSVALNLHRGNLQAAEDDLVALSGVARMNVKDPTLVGQMIRVAIEGLSASALWEAVQDQGWTEAQLAHIQHSWQMEPLAPAVVGALHAQRLEKIEEYEVFRRGSYRAWQSKAAALLSGFGARPQLPSFPVEMWREYIFHPVWGFAWADHEEALWLERTDSFWIDLQERSRRRAFSHFDWKESNVSHFAAWRFYFELPLIEKMSEIIGGNPPAQRSSILAELLSLLDLSFKNDFSLPNYPRAISVAANNENLRQMAVTALALKRYQIKHGSFPRQLSDLVPTFLPELPVDWMDGQPLRYVLKADGTYSLYSVGEDGRDDGGDPMPPANKTFERWHPNGRDHVWPVAVPWEK